LVLRRFGFKKLLGKVGVSDSSKLTKNFSKCQVQNIFFEYFGKFVFSDPKKHIYARNFTQKWQKSEF